MNEKELQKLMQKEVEKQKMNFNPVTGEVIKKDNTFLEGKIIEDYCKCPGCKNYTLVETGPWKEYLCRYCGMIFTRNQLIK